MSDGTDNLIERLLLEACAIMEDASPEFARAWPPEKDAQAKRIARLTEAADTLSALGAAAHHLHRRADKLQLNKP